MKSAFRLALSLALLAPLAGCGLPGADRDPPRIFVLSPKSTFSADLPKVEWQLVVDVPVAEAGINNSKIALRHNPLQLEYFARANWTDTAPVMVQTRLVESFENTGKIVSVGRQSIALRGDYVLVSELRAFQAEYDGAGPPKAHVRLIAKLVRMPQRQIVATFNTEYFEPAAGDRLEAIVEAFDEASGKCFKRIVEWAMTAVPPGRVLPGLGNEVPK